jgi:hypothetical protein
VSGSRVEATDVSSRMDGFNGLATLGLFAFGFSFFRKLLQE